MKTRGAILPITVACLSALLVSGHSRAQSANSPGPNHALVDKIVVASDRHAPTLPPQGANFEIYLLNLDGSEEQRLTHNSVGDGFGTLSPDGKKIAFVSNRLVDEPGNDPWGLFVMNADGTDQTFLARGSSPSWSPDGKYIAFHASASGTGRPINANPGAATEDSDIFVVSVDDLLQHGTPPTNLTHDPTAVDDDPDWSPDGTKIAYTSHDLTQRPPNLDYTTAEIYVRAADGTGTPIRLTDNAEEERAPNWSHQGDRIAYMCHAGGLDFEICVMAADGTNQRQLTDNNVGDLSCAWSPNDDRIIFQRVVPGRGNLLRWVTTAEGTHSEDYLVPPEAPTGGTFFPDVGVLRVKVDNTLAQDRLWQLEQDATPGGLGSKIVFTRLAEGPESNEALDAEIWVMNGDGGAQRRLTHNTTFDLGAVWSPNGRRIAFSGPQFNSAGRELIAPRIFLIDADGGSETQLTDPSVRAMFPNWSPNGKQIAFHGIYGGAGATEVLVIDADGAEPVNLTNHPSADARADFSPSGQKIAFQSNRDGNAEIYVMNADGTEPVRLTTNPAADQAPDWSPDGKQIAFQSNRDGNIEIYVMNADGTEQTRLTDYPGRDLDPAWSPNGQQITFDRDIDPIEAQIRQQFVMDADGSGATQLTVLPSENGHGDWGRGPALEP
jgi:Tol biopolymer transport system component